MHVSPELFRSSRVLIVGDVALDRYIYGTVDRISPEAPVPVLMVQSSRTSPGCAANVAANVVALGARATLIGVVGRDEDAGHLSRALAASGVDLIATTDSSRRTTVKTRYIAAGQQVVRADQENTHAISLDMEDRVLEEFSAHLPMSDVVVLSDYCKGVITDRVLRSVLEQAAAAGVPVLVDPKRNRLADYRGAALIKPNRKELAAATGLPCNTDEEAQSAAARMITETGAMIMLTRSEKGISLFRAGKAPVHERAEAREVFDVSGAGDTVMAVIAAAVASGIEIAEAMRLANVAAGIVVGKLGTATVTIAELVRAIEAAKDGFESRIVDIDTAIETRRKWAEQGLVCGFTNGCFDLVHPGHISLLAQAKRECDRLIVALNSDDSVRRLKGPSRPLQLEQARAYVMASIEHVDLVVLFDEDTPLEVIKELRPDVLIKGADYREDQVVGADLVKSWGGRVVLADLVPAQSTTNLAKRSKLAVA